VRFNRVVLIVLMLIPIAASAALAQATVEQWTPRELAWRGATPEFVTWLAGEGKNRKQEIVQNLREQVENWPFECKEVKLETGWTFGIFLPIIIDASGDVVSGVWREGYDVTTCGIKRQLNIIFVADSSAIKLGAGMPGTSIAGPTLQHDAGMAFYAKRGKNCDQAYALDTKFIGYTDPAPEAKPGEPQKAWREDWTLWACGKEIVVPFTFTANARGTQWTTATQPEKP
jgi:hypothetical protein